jgi:catechol 2,3-dioxygenase-like lactoylglutathione lyase family enzyme
MPKATNSYLGAAGIGVSDLEKSYDFYTRVCGLKKL